MRNMRFFDPDFGVVTRGLGRTLAFQVSTIGMLLEDQHDQDSYVAFASANGDDMFDPLTMLLWWRERTKATRLQQQLHTEIDEMQQRRAHHRYLSAFEVQQRMDIGNGACPCCGESPNFYEKEGKQKGDEDRFAVIACRHLRRKTAPARGFVHKPESWNGGLRWPFVDGHPVADADGYPFSDLAAPEKEVANVQSD